MEPPPRLTFPCDYPIKVMVRAEHGVRAHIDAILERHAGPLDLSSVTERPSAQQHFLELCELFQHPKPADVDLTGESYTFEKGVAKQDGGKGWAKAAASDRLGLFCNWIRRPTRSRTSTSQSFRRTGCRMR